MVTKYEKGYQAILYKNDIFDQTPIAQIAQLQHLVDSCERAKLRGQITHYIIRYVEAKYDILTPLELGII